MDSHQGKDLQRQLDLMRGDVATALAKSHEAYSIISSHERLCAERYDNIKSKMLTIPKIFEKMEDLQKLANRMIGGLLLASTGFFAVIIAVIVYISKMH